MTRKACHLPFMPNVGWTTTRYLTLAYEMLSTSLLGDFLVTREPDLLSRSHKEHLSIAKKSQTAYPSSRSCISLAFVHSLALSMRFLFFYTSMFLLLLILTD